MSAATELATLPPKETALQVYRTPKGLDPFLQQIRDKLDQFVPDTKTKKGRDAIASIAYSVARSKTALDNIGKDLVAELKEVPKLIDAERKRMRETLEGWQAEVRKPLTDWEEAETSRVAKHEQAIERLKAHGAELGLLTSEDLLDRIGKVEGTALGDSWEEFAAEAGQVKDQVLVALRTALAARQKYEAEQAELERLRKEKAEREEQDRIAEAQRIAVEQERQRVSNEQQAQRDAEAKKLADAERKTQEAERQRQQAEKDRIAAEQRAKQERIDSEARAKAAAEEARLDEQRRQKAAADEILRQQKAREADRDHKAKIMGAAKEALMGLNLTEEQAKAVVLSIGRGEIPNITINF